MRRLPPLNALRVFEVAERTGSYAAAAAELGLTHGAISRHIDILEAWLGQTLFRRDGRRMAATPIAAMFADEVGHALDRVARAAEACGKPTTRRILRVSAPTSFAMRWLIPRLDRFHADHPHIEVIVTTVSTVLEDVDTLIASPALLERRPIKTPADIEGHVLLASKPAQATGPTGSMQRNCRIWSAIRAGPSIISL
jgi:DNA-binding transcriptional LysR family regulator